MSNIHIDISPSFTECSCLSSQYSSYDLDAEKEAMTAKEIASQSSQPLQSQQSSQYSSHDLDAEKEAMTTQGIALQSSQPLQSLQYSSPDLERRNHC